MSEGKLTGPIQESVLTLICMDDKKGSIAANIIDVSLFEPPYDDIAARAIEYRRKFKKPPGEAHLDDLFDHILSDPKNKKLRIYQQVLGAILELAKGLNADYTLSRVNEFMRRQNLKAAILDAAERFQRGGDEVLADAEGILLNALKFKPNDVDRGIYLSDKKGIDFLTRHSVADYYLGIPEFDRRGIGLTRGEAVGLMAPKGRGKTWGCVHVGTMVVLQGGKVLHVSLEMKDERIVPRYLRRFFAIAKRKEQYRRTYFELDDLDRVVGFKSKLGHPRLSLRDPNIESKVARKMQDLGTRLNHLHIKSFPTSRLTTAQLSAYMDNLEASDGFVPDVLILDYPKLMRLDRRQELRIGLGLQMEELRGICGERNICGFFPLQGTRETEDVKLITGKHIGEDYSLGQTLDTLITYNQTKAEKELGLARLYVDKARSDEDGFTVLITQDYETGQFCKQSAFMPNTYWSLLKSQNGEDEE